MSAHGALTVWCEQAKASCSCPATCACQQQGIYVLLLEVVIELPDKAQTLCIMIGDDDSNGDDHPNKATSDYKQVLSPSCIVHANHTHESG